MKQSLYRGRQRPTAARPALVAIALSVVSLALCVPLTAHAQWKWRDSNGRLHASDLPPPITVAEKDILQRPGPPRATVAGSASAAPTAGSASAASATVPRQRTAQERDVEQRQKAETQDKLARKTAEDERLAGQRKDNCQRAREAVATLESGQRVARISASGEREILTDAQRADDLRRARSVAASDCT
jgi:hypothetical protein